MMSTGHNPLEASLQLPFADALERVRAGLAQEGFGIITEIDMRRTFKDKLGAEFRDYVILGACNPGLAHRALSAAPETGLFLPCNVVVYADDAGTRVSAFDPMAMLRLGMQPEAVRDLAFEVHERLVRVIDWMGKGTPAA